MINKKTILIFLAKIAEVYPVGYCKIAPGTFASLIALPIGFYLFNFLGVVNYILFIFVFTLIGFIVSEIHVKIYKIKDPKEVVIDEFSGQFIALLGIIHSDNNLELFFSIILSFLLFRFFDITKIGPIKKFELLPGGIGIMADDMIAGLCAFILQCGILTALDKQLLINI